MSVVANIPPPPFSGLSLGPLDLRMYGLLIAIGALLAFQLLVSRYARFGGDPAVAERAGMVALIGGLLGARIGYVIPRLDDFLTRPGDILAIWQGGLAFFGGLAGGALVLIIYLRRTQADLPAMLDAFAPALPLAQAVGRWGNYFNQELYGRPTDLPWALEVEERFRRPGYADTTTFHPTFLYESLWNLGLVGVLLWIDRRGWLRRRGSLVFVYLIGYGLGRGWIELLRIDTAERYLGLSRNNLIAILVVLIGIVGLLVWERRGPLKEPAEDAEEPSDETEEPEATDDSDKPEATDDSDKPEATDDSDKPEATDDSDKPEATDPDEEPEATEATEISDDAIEATDNPDR